MVSALIEGVGEEATLDFLLFGSSNYMRERHACERPSRLKNPNNAELVCKEGEKEMKRMLRYPSIYCKPKNTCDLRKGAKTKRPHRVPLSNIRKGSTNTLARSSSA